MSNPFRLVNPDGAHCRWLFVLLPRGLLFGHALEDDEPASPALRQVPAARAATSSPSSRSTVTPAALPD